MVNSESKSSCCKNCGKTYSKVPNRPTAYGPYCCGLCQSHAQQKEKKKPYVPVLDR